jgi:DNA ligase (NAD+)
MSDIKLRIEWANSVELSEFLSFLRNASDAYYNTDSAILTDDEFDMLIEIYNKRSSEPYTYIGVDVPDDKNKVKLPFHMGSMNKIKTKEGILKWLKQSINNFETILVTPKIDGTSAMIVYFAKTDKTEIYTRGNGDIGKNINFLEPYLFPADLKKKVKEYLDLKGIEKFVCRGEMIISKSDFEKFNIKYKSARSMVNGITNKKNGVDESELNNIEFALFEVIEPKMIPNVQFNISKEIGFNVVNYKLVKCHEIINNLKLFDNTKIDKTDIGKILVDYRNNYNYDIDGIILTVNDLYDIPEKGNPDYSIAFKINDLGKTTKITKIVWNISKHKQLIPTIEFEPIKLGSGNINVKRCTGFNGGFIFNNCLGPGAVIRVVLSGEVIPYLIEVLEPTDDPQMPEENYSWNSTKIQCYLTDGNDSDDYKLKKIVIFIKTLEIDYLGDGLLKHLYNNGFNTLKKILCITKVDLLKLDRIEDKMASKLIKSINDKINSDISLSKIMDGSLCFGNGFGQKRCVQIINKYPNFLELCPSKDNLNELSGWSDKSSEKFLKGLSDFKDFLKENDYLKFKINDNNFALNKNESSVDIKKICITGKRDKRILEFIKNNNVELSGSITNDLDLLVCEEKNGTSGKIKEAIKKNIKIVTIDEFLIKYLGK